MLKTCKSCNKEFPSYAKIDGKSKRLDRRSFCLECVPFGSRPGRKSTDNVSTDARTEKECSTCKQIKPISNFYVRSDNGRRGKARSECKDCLGDYLTERYKKHKIEAIESMGGKCADCGNKYRMEIYDFHHLDPSQKDLDWRKIRQCSKEKRAKELAKCVLLCSNCHRSRHCEIREE